MGAQVDAEELRAAVSEIDWWLMCICCGAALGMVLSSWPIFVLIPLVAIQATGFSLRGPLLAGGGFEDETPRGLKPAAQASLEHPRGLKPAARRSAHAFGVAIKQTVGGVAVGVLAYLITNPYIVINAFANREVLASNFGNSFAMYEIARVADGFVRVIELTAEGATWPILVLGAVALIVATVRRRGLMLPLTVPAIVFFLQFVMIGAGKPAEYGRFGIFTNTALAIGTACLLARRWTKLRDIVNWVPAMFLVIWVGSYGALYALNFQLDTIGEGSRTRARRHVEALDYIRTATGLPPVWVSPNKIAVVTEPAPYCCPPLEFHRSAILLFPTWDGAVAYAQAHPEVHHLLRHLDQRGSPQDRIRPPSFWHFITHPRTWARLRETPISWANKPIEMSFIKDTTRSPLTYP